MTSQHEAVRYTHATAYIEKYGEKKLLTRIFWSIEDFHAFHHDALGTCGRMVLKKKAVPPDFRRAP